MTFKQRHELGEGVTLTDIWRKSVLGQGNSRGKGLEARLCLACLGIARKTVLLGKASHGTVVGGDFTEAMGTNSWGKFRRLWFLF